VSEIDPGDIKSLAMARPQVTREALDALVGYQRGKLAANDAPVPATLERGRLEVLQALVRDYCGRRWTARKLEARRQELLAQKASGPLSPKDAEKLAAAEKERARVNDLSLLEARYGKEALDLLREREDELLELHEQLRGCA
jgi:hypothetical protein